MRYYCHHCHTSINADDLLPEFRCPSCQSGFIEEIPASSSRRSSNVDDSNRSSEDGGPGHISNRMSSDEYSDDNSDVELFEAFNGPLAQIFGPFFQQQSSSTSTTAAAGQSSQQQQDSGSNTTLARVLRSTRSSGRSTPGQAQSGFFESNNQASIAGALQDFLNQVSMGPILPEGSSSASPGAQGSSSGVPTSASRGLININFPLPQEFFQLHSNPGDYAWGNAGFDAVITQLLNNLDGSNSGPPPMPKDQVDNLPTVKISDDQVKSTNLQCTVCMEDFQVGASARQLPCEHFFHQDCIIPWLNLVSRTYPLLVQLFFVILSHANLIPLIPYSMHPALYAARLLLQEIYHLTTLVQITLLLMRQCIPVLLRVNTPILIILAQILRTREPLLEPHLHQERSEIEMTPLIMITPRMIVINKGRFILVDSMRSMRNQAYALKIESSCYATSIFEIQLVFYVSYECTCMLFSIGRAAATMRAVAMMSH